MRRMAWLSSGVALLPMLAHAAGGGWGAGGGSAAIDTAARAAAASAMALAQGSVQQSRNLSDLSSPSVALGNLGGIPAGAVGAPSGVAALDAGRKVLAAQIPFGSFAGLVADGGTLAAAAAIANAAIPSSMIGAASGVASLNGSKLVPASQIPFGTASGTVADGGALTAAASMANSALQPGGSGSGLVFTPTGSSTAITGAGLAALANAAIPSSMIGAASGVASLNGSKMLTASQIPFGTTAGTVADGGTLAAVATTANAAVPSGLAGAASGVATLDANKLVPSAQIPFGTATGKVADGGALATVTTTANAAVPSSRLGAATGVATLDANKLLLAAQVPFGTATNTVADGGVLAAASAKVNSALQPAAIGSTVASYNDPRITGAAPSSGAVLTGAQLAADPAANDTGKDIVDASWVVGRIAAAGGTATTVGAGTDLSQGNITPTGASSSRTAGAFALLAQNAVQSSQVAAASGVAQLDGNRLLLLSELPIGTTAGTVGDGGLLASTTATASSAIQPGTSSALGTPITWNPIAAPGETTGRAAGTRAGDVYNLADHGADGTAANDDAALNKAIAYAAARSGTIIYLPQNINGQPWQFLASSLFTFCLPSNTTFAGAGINSTSIAWNDNDGNGWYLFGSSYNGTVTPGVRPVNITLRDFKVIGTWSVTDFKAGAGWDGVGSVDGLTERNIESDYSRGFGLAGGYSTNVLFDGDVVNYSYADGISAQADSNLEMLNLKIRHVNDDCLSAHMEQGSPETVRRDILIGNLSCFDTQAVDIAAPQHLSINNVLMESPKGGALVIATQGTGGNGEGSANSVDVAVSNFTVVNLLGRSAVDSYNGGNTAITIDGTAARSNGTATLPAGQTGNGLAIPGESTPGQGYIRDPYPEWMANSNSASIAMNGDRAINLVNIAVLRTFPAANGTDSRFPNFASFGQGLIAGYSALVNPTPADADFRGGCFQINGGYIRGLSINGLTCDGVNFGLYVVANSGTNKLDDISVTNSHFRDLNNFGFAENVNSTSTVMVTLTNSDFDMDPYDKGPRLAAANNGGLYGGWQQQGSGCAYVAFCGGGGNGSLLAFGNTIKNAYADTIADTTSTSTSWKFGVNYDMAQITTPNAYAASNLGIAVTHPGFEIVPIDANPNDAAYGSITSVKVTAAPSYPTSGIWHVGDYVRNTVPTASTPTQGWLRVTNTNTAGTNGAPNNYALGTDWIAK